MARLALYTALLYYFLGNWLRDAILFLAREAAILIGVGFSWPIIGFHDPFDLIMAVILLVFLPAVFFLRWRRHRSEIMGVQLALYLNVCAVVAGPLSVFESSGV